MRARVGGRRGISPASFWEAPIALRRENADGGRAPGSGRPKTGGAAAGSAGALGGVAAAWFSFARRRRLGGGARCRRGHGHGDRCGSGEPGRRTRAPFRGNDRGVRRPPPARGAWREPAGGRPGPARMAGAARSARRWAGPPSPPAGARARRHPGPAPRDRQRRRPARAGGCGPGAAGTPRGSFRTPRSISHHHQRALTLYRLEMRLSDRRQSRSRGESRSRWSR